MKIFGKSVFELIYRWRSYDLDKILEEIREVKVMAPDDFRQWQQERCWQMAKHHHVGNAYYREKVGDALPEKWEELPVMTKADMQMGLDVLVTQPYRIKDLYVNNTSGSSGIPLTFVKDLYTQARVWAYKKYFSNLHDIDYFYSKEAKFYGIPRSPRGYAVQKIKDWILNRERFVVFDLSDTVMDEWVERFRSTKFDYVYGYTSSIVLFCRHLISKGIVLNEICPTLKVVIVTSEVCSKEDRKIIHEACGVEARNEYGTAEAGLLGYECAHGSIHLVEENVFIEINDNNEILVTDLFNLAFPLIRYKVGDMAKLSDDACGCASSNRVVKELQGRTNDVALLRSGRRIPGLTFYYISRALLESSGVLKEFIIRQTAIDTFEFDVVSEQPLKSEDIEELKKTAEEYLEPGLNILVHQLERIERPVSGKIKHFYSELPKL